MYPRGRGGLFYIREFQQGFTTDLPTIYQRFTKNKAIFGILLSKIYQGFTKDLPKIRKYLAFYFLNIRKYLTPKMCWKICGKSLVN